MATTVSPETVCACEPLAAPASRASWCGQLRIGSFSVPVKAYAAIATPPDIPLRQLHAGCGERIEYRKWCPKHGAVAPEEIVKGYPYQPDQYVELLQAELEQLEPPDEKTIDVYHFLPPACVDPVLLAGRSLCLAPANPAARRPFAVVQQALQKSGNWGLGRVVFSNRWQIVLVRPVNPFLLVHTIYHPAQRRALPSTQPLDVEIDRKELRPLVRLIDSAGSEIPWEDYEDDLEHRVTALVEAKLASARNSYAKQSNGRRRSASAGPKSQAKMRTSRATSRAKRKAA